MLINSIKYNDNPIIKILIRISREKKSDGYFVKIEFEDNGTGIDDSRKILIFEKNYKDISNISGMGLGLSLAKKIIEIYNGKITVEDKVKGDPSKGSNFIITIPEIWN